MPTCLMDTVKKKKKLSILNIFTTDNFIILLTFEFDI